MNQTQTARLSIVFLSLLYFPSLIVLSLMITHLQPLSNPLLTCLLYAVTLLFLLLPAAGCWIYREIRSLPGYYLLLSIIPIIICATVLFFTPILGSGISSIFSAIYLLVIFLNPFIQLLYLPVWLTIPSTTRPYYIPLLLAIISPALQILINVLWVLEILSVRDAVPVLLCISFAVSILAGIMLLIRGITHPEILTSSSSGSTS